MLFGKQRLSTCEMSKAFWNLAAPQIITCIIYEIVLQSNLIFTGHMGDATKLAGVGLSVMITNIIGMSVCCGMNDALATLSS